MGDNFFFGANCNVNVSKVYAGLLEEARSIDGGLNMQPKLQRPTTLKFAPPARPAALKCPKSGSRVYTVSRDGTAGARSKSGHSGHEGKENVALQRDYGGTFYSTRFRSSHRIVLLEIGFHGPAEVPVAKYNVYVEIFATDASTKEIFPNGYSSQCIFKWTWKGATGKRGQVLRLPIETPLVIRPGKWYMIQFMLEGEPTCRCLSTLTSVSVPIKGGKESVEFSFNHGSMQMPELKFTI